MGIWDAKGPAATNTINKTIECVIPEIGVLPPDLTFITVLIVAPAPGNPLKNPPTAFPIPWPINSLFESCLVWVILSATNEVNRESIAPRTASCYPPVSINVLLLQFGILNCKPPFGMSPILAN